MILDEKIAITSEEWDDINKWLGSYTKTCDVISERNQGTSDGYKACQTSEKVKIFIRQIKARAHSTTEKRNNK